MDLNFTFTNFGVLNDPYAIALPGMVTVLLVMSVTLLLRYGRLRAILISMFITAGIVTTVSLLIAQYSSLPQRTIEAYRVNEHNLTVLRSGAQDTYGIHLTNKQAQGLLDNFVYNTHTREDYAIAVSRNGLTDRVLLKQDESDKRWAFYSVQSQLMPKTVAG